MEQEAKKEEEKNSTGGVGLCCSSAGPFTLLSEDGVDVQVYLVLAAAS